MEPGRFRERIILEKPAEGKDSLGGNVTGWVELATVRAAFASPRAQEIVAADREASRPIMTVLVRTSSIAREVTAKWRIRDARKPADVYEIRWVNTWRDDGLVSMVVEGRA